MSTDRFPGDRRLLVVALLFFALNLWRYGDYLLDDTFISFRYAQNLVAGNGLVFNVGERVEGYTNFLFVLIAALCLRLGLDPVGGTKAVSLGCVILLGFTLIRLEGHAPSCPPVNETRGPRRRRRGALHFTLALAFLLPLPGFAYWAAASFETMLFASLMLMALVILRREYESRRWRGAVVVFVLLALTRPEGAFVFAAATMAFLVLGSTGYAPNPPVGHPTNWRGTRRRAQAPQAAPSPLRARQPLQSAWRLSIVNAITFALAYGAYFAWRYTYYGDLVPNTFRAKVTGGWEQVLTGLQYLGTWARTYPVLASALLLPAASVSRRVRGLINRDRSSLALYAVALMYAAYVTLVGGDFMPFHRFFVPLLPLCCLLFARSVMALPPKRRPRVIVAAFALHVTCGYLTDEPYRAFVAHRTAVVGRQVGERLAQQLAPDDLIAVNTAGALPYYSGRPAIDMLGLTDATIAQRPVFIVSPGWAGHRRGWGAYVLDRRPRVIFFYNAAGSREPFYLSDHELADDPYFRFFYQPRSFRIAAAGALSGVLAGRFLGFPFGFDESGHAPWPDLGLESRFEHEPVPHTDLYEGPTIAHYFAFDARDESLWRARQPGNIEAFLATAVTAWTTLPRPASDPAARERVEILCAAAYQKIEQGDTAAAKALLTSAAQQNKQGRSPLVYQYIANVAVLDGDLFSAIAAQKEALRLAPTNELYRRNLLSLLRRPYKR